MSRILIAERDPLYRQALETVLASHGHQVRSAADGREALAAGVVFAPQVLLTGWLLGDHYHGLHVTEALGLVHPGMRGLLSTRLGSPDLGWAAAHLGVFEVLPKPVEVGRLLQVIGNATGNATADRGSEPRRWSPLAVLVTDSDGRLLYRNPAGRRLADGGAAALLIGTLLPGNVELADLCREWRLLERPDHGSWLARARCLEVPDSDSTAARRELRYVVVVLPDEDAGDHLDSAFESFLSDTYYDADLLIRALLDLGPPSPPLAVTPARALVVDPLGERRRGAGRRLERGGLVCHLAAEETRVRSILRQDPGVGLVLLHSDLPLAELESLVQMLEATLPAVQVVGVGSSSEGPFPALGVERVLSAGWSLDELKSMVE